ncbi:hypothetical protein HDU82_008576 [Entophlyctis luteolus]|nr:hypothetical protein HDU82_008576 [Entophlyctis luteolus]
MRDVRLGFGAMGFSHTYGAADREACLALLDRASQSGIVFIDSADIYGAGHNEELIAEWMARDEANRDKLFLCTKFGFKFGYSYPNICGSPEYVKDACDASLKRLGVNCIDLYYQHRVDPDTPIEVTVGAMADLVKEGKVKYIGLSEASAETIRRAHKIHPISAVQVEYSPWERGIEQNGVLDACRELGIVVVAFSPLGRGFLTGKYKSIEDFAPVDARRNHPRFMADAFEPNMRIVNLFEQIASEKHCSPAQLALAWLMAQQQVKVIPIPGTTKVAKLEENLGSLNVTITEKENAVIRAVLEKYSVTGERFPVPLLKTSWK